VSQRAWPASPCRWLVPGFRALRERLFPSARITARPGYTDPVQPAPQRTNVPDVGVALRAGRRGGEFVNPFMLEDPVRKRTALKQGHGFVPPAWHVREHVHAADEGQAAVDHDDLLMRFPEVERAVDLRRQFVVAGLQVAIDRIARQNYGMDFNAAILSMPKMREQLFRTFPYPWTPQPYALPRLVDPAAQLAGKAILVVEVNQGGVVAQGIPYLARDGI